MNAGRYTLKDFLTNHNLEQILIPEIQRDYVWNAENVQKLMDSFTEDAGRENYNSEAVSDDTIQKLPQHLREAIAREMEKTSIFSNIGFLYAYHDFQMPDRYMLIDGQQRITTAFLILLCTYIREGRQLQFRKLYFKDKNPVVDYKVRETSHFFLADFIDFLLVGGDVNQVRNQYWYYDQYKTDITIQSLLQNYVTIVDITRSSGLTADYIENRVEFWYFDTSKSEQGEELYLYMNSRGESVQTNENIKAGLLEKEDSTNKNEWGTKWEHWQNIFWKNRGKDNSNSDRGFNEFLRWIKVIENVKTDEKEKSSTLTDYVRSIKESIKFSNTGLNLAIIESYVKAAERLAGMNISQYFTAAKLNGDASALDYVKLLPLLMYAEKRPDAKEIEIIRFAQFFLNITRFELISKSPFPHTVQAVKLTARFLDEGNKDITDLVKYATPGRYENILTEEEVTKLKLYSDPPLGSTREELEQLFWEAEAFKLCDGRISIIWDCTDFYPVESALSDFSKNTFQTYFGHLKNLFTEPGDLLRRALLTKGDYAIEHGYTASLEGTRYSFGNFNWIKIFEDGTNRGFLRLLLDDIVIKQKENPDGRINELLNIIISGYLENGPEKDWLYYFVKLPEIFAYCRQKLICFAGEEFSEIYLLQDRKAAVHNYEELGNFIPSKKK